MHLVVQTPLFNAEKDSSKVFNKQLECRAIKRERHDFVWNTRTAGKTRSALASLMSESKILQREVTENPSKKGARTRQNGHWRIKERRPLLIKTGEKCA